MRIRLVVTGRRYHGARSLPAELDLPDGSMLGEALASVGGLMAEGERLPESALIAVGGTHLGTVGRHEPRRLRDGDELVILMPVAGG